MDTSTAIREPPHTKSVVPRGASGGDDCYFADSDDKRVSDDTVQYRWTVTIKGNYDDVFVAGDLLWYAEHDRYTARQAPDVPVVFGRPKGDRGS